MTGTLLPCSECGAELFYDGESVTKRIEEKFEFGGETHTRELPAKKCPECGAVTAL